MSKADYVRGEAAIDTTTNHHCHWPGCTKRTPPAMWGCRAHWYKLPLSIRTRIWRTFRPGQEKSKTPSREYIEAAKAAQDWISEHEKGKLL